MRYYGIGFARYRTLAGLNPWFFMAKASALASLLELARQCDRLFLNCRETRVTNPIASSVERAKQSAALCQACGLCCDGTLFSYVALRPFDLPKVEGKPLRIEKNKKGEPRMLQPCSALQGTKCSIYHDRPRLCQTYLCKLTRNVLNGSRSYQEALDDVAALKRYSAVLSNSQYLADLQPSPDVADDPAEIHPTAPYSIFKAIEQRQNQVTKGLWQLLTDKFADLRRKIEDKTLTRGEYDFLLDAFDAVSLVDRSFEDTSLLRKYGILIQAAERQGLFAMD